MKRIKGPVGTVIEVTDDIAEMVLKDPEFSLAEDEPKRAAPAKAAAKPAAKSE